MTTDEINNQLEELRKLWPTALHQDREILKRRARALRIALERRKNGR